MADLIITDDCIGCGSCVELCAAAFAMNKNDSRAVVKDPAAAAPCVEEAMETCPVGCIVRE